MPATANTDRSFNMEEILLRGRIRDPCPVQATVIMAALSASVSESTS